LLLLAPLLLLHALGVLHLLPPLQDALENAFG
jgi:hypothetical protein